MPNDTSTWKPQLQQKAPQKTSPVYVYLVIALFALVLCVCCGATGRCVYKRVKKRRKRSRRPDHAEAARHPSLAHQRYYYRSNMSALFPRRALVLRNPLYLPEYVFLIITD